MYGTFTQDRIVAETTELRRVRDMPRRNWQEDPELELLRVLLTKSLKHTPDRCKYGPLECAGCRVEVLSGVQATLLKEFHDLGCGAVGTMCVGSGKTLVSLLAATVIQAQRPILIIPAQLRPKTTREYKEYCRHWRILPMKVVSYEWLANPKQLAWFQEYQPDLVVADESSAMKSSGTKVAKRLSKYLRGNVSARYLDLDGSTAGRGIGEFWHRTRWALRSRAPVTADPLEAAAWGWALNEKVPEEMRFEPGALLTLGKTPPGESPVRAARLAFQDRFVSTPGVVSTMEETPHVGLRLWTDTVKIPPEAEQAIRDMRDTWQTPDGHTFKLAMELWRHAREIGCGLYYRWDPYPPQEWIQARLEWHQYCREALKHSQRLDSFVHLVEEIKAGTRKDGGLYERWKRVKPTFEPNSVPVWVHDAMLNRCADWLAGGPRRLVWSEHSAFGKRLSELTGVPYYSKGGLNPAGQSVDKTAGPAIVSLKACRKGLNLQFLYHENLFPSPYSKGDWIEQALGRTHRTGQTESIVMGEFLLTCTESYQSLAQACWDSQYAQDTLGQPQKLCYADKDFEGINLLSPDQLKEQGI